MTMAEKNTGGSSLDSSEHMNLRFAPSKIGLEMMMGFQPCLHGNCWVPNVFSLQLIRWVTTITTDFIYLPSSASFSYILKTWYGWSIFVCESPKCFWVHHQGYHCQLDVDIHQWYQDKNIQSSNYCLAPTATVLQTQADNLQCLRCVKNIRFILKFTMVYHGLPWFTTLLSMITYGNMTQSGNSYCMFLRTSPNLVAGWWPVSH